MAYFYTDAWEFSLRSQVDNINSSVAADDADASAAADAADDAGALCMLCTVVCLTVETDPG